MSPRVEDVFAFFGKMMLDDGCIIVSPKRDAFRPKERDFLDGIRNVPADISGPAGVNPYSFALREQGRWVFVWIPDK